MKTIKNNIFNGVDYGEEKFFYIISHSFLLITAIKHIIKYCGWSTDNIYDSQKESSQFIEQVKERGIGNNQIVIIITVEMRYNIQLLMCIRKKFPRSIIVAVGDDFQYIDDVIAKHYQIDVLFSTRDQPEKVMFIFDKNSLEEIYEKKPSGEFYPIEEKITKEINRINNDVDSSLVLLGLSEIDISILKLYSRGMPLKEISNILDVNEKNVYNSVYKTRIKLSGKTPLGKIIFANIWAETDNQLLNHGGEDDLYFNL
ncbi:response regulator transcription factor [Salmonella enterica subsp. enterica serovar Braenderup]|nr:Uncharacterised protein [Salmonella enterica subsp. enterica serovar Braenderup]